MSTAFIQEIKITLTSPSKELLNDLRVNAYGDLDVMLRSGVFSFKSGHAEIHRDNKGKLQAIFIKQKSYPQFDEKMN